MIENELIKRNNKTDNTEKQFNIFKTNDTFFKERKNLKFEPKSTRFVKKTALKLPNAHLNTKLNLSDSVLTFTDSTGFSNEKLTSSQNNFKIKKIKFKDPRQEPEDAFSGALTNSITKWSNQLTPIKISESKSVTKNVDSSKNTAIIEYKKEKKPKIQAKLVLQPPAEINRLMDIIDRENTNFSIKIAYDNLFTSRDDAVTPHTYLHLDIDPKLALARENTIKNMQLLEPEHFRMLRQKTLSTPGLYQTIKRPTQNLYSELVLLDEFYKKNNNKRPSPTKNSKKKASPKASFKKDKFVNYQSLDFLDSGLNTERDDDKNFNLQTESNEPYALNNHFTHSTNSMIDSQEKLGSKNYQKNNDLILLEGLAHSIRLKDTLKEIPIFNKKSPTKQLRKTTTTSNTKQPKKPTLKEFKYCILTDLKIGEGEFSETFQGYRYDMGAPIKIAAKRLKISKEKDEQNVQNLLSEIAVLTQLGKHNYVIDFLGVHNHLDTMYLVFEYAEKGDLKRLLDLCRKSSRREILLNNMYKIRIAYEIASGMEYISSLDIVHKDLAARNVLLDKDYSCKISDFGCCKSEFLTKMPIRWMAPESLNKLLFSTASDVWSYGILLWELYTYGTTPYPGMTDDEVVGRINQWYRLYKPQDCPNEVYAIMLSCWKDYHKARPRFTLIKNKFRDLYKAANDLSINGSNI